MELEQMLCRLGSENVVVEGMKIIPGDAFSVKSISSDDARAMVVINAGSCGNDKPITRHTIKWLQGEDGDDVSLDSLYYWGEYRGSKFYVREVFFIDFEERFRLRREQVKISNKK